jgi:hypothetical protein
MTRERRRQTPDKSRGGTGAILPCREKAVYGSRAEAERTAVWLYEQGVEVDPYPCPHCSPSDGEIWHLGSRDKKPRVRW